MVDDFLVPILNNCTDTGGLLKDTLTIHDHPLSLKKSKESKERNVDETYNSHSLTSQITYMFTVLNELMENTSKKINKSLLATGTLDTFIYNFLTSINLDEDSIG